MNAEEALLQKIAELEKTVSVLTKQNKAEVKSMFLTEYNEEKVMEKERQEGAMQEREKVASTMLKEGGMSASFISRMTQLSEEAVRKSAKALGIAVL